jgi:hypothetical protein
MRSEICRFIRCCISIRRVCFEKGEQANELCDAEVDEGSLRIGVEETHVDLIADFEAVLSTNHATFDWWVEDADVDTFIPCTSDDAVEELADAV